MTTTESIQQGDAAAASHLRREAIGLARQLVRYADQWERANSQFSAGDGRALLRRSALAFIDRWSKEPRPSSSSIVIEVLGGVVQDVKNVPPGYEYEIVDWDDIKAEEEAAGRSA